MTIGISPSEFLLSLYADNLKNQLLLENLLKGDIFVNMEMQKLNTIGKVATPTILLQWLQYANYIDIILAIQLGQHRE